MRQDITKFLSLSLRVVTITPLYIVNVYTHIYIYVYTRGFVNPSAVDRVGTLKRQAEHRGFTVSGALGPPMPPSVGPPLSFTRASSHVRHIGQHERMRCFFSKKRMWYLN